MNSPSLLPLIPWIGAGVTGILLAWAFWQWLHPQEKLMWMQKLNKTIVQRVPINREWLELTGIPITPQQLRYINWAFGAFIAIVIFIVVHNPIVGVAFGFLSSTFPEAGVRWYARKQWVSLDLSAFAAINTLSFFLARHQSVLESLRKIIPDSDEPFRSWSGKLLTAEATGIPIEVSLKQSAEKIKHIELGLIADILAVERRKGGTAPMVARSVELWSHRLRADGMRRGRLQATAMISRGIMVIAVAVYWILVWRDPTAQRAISHGIGIVVTGISASVITAAGMIQQRVTRSAEQI